MTQESQIFKCPCCSRDVSIPNTESREVLWRIAVGELYRSFRHQSHNIILGSQASMLFVDHELRKGKGQNEKDAKSSKVWKKLRKDLRQLDEIINSMAQFRHQDRADQRFQPLSHVEHHVKEVWRLLSNYQLELDINPLRSSTKNLDMGLYRAAFFFASSKGLASASRESASEIHVNFQADDGVLTTHVSVSGTNLNNEEEAWLLDWFYWAVSLSRGRASVIQSKTKNSFDWDTPLIE